MLGDTQLSIHRASSGGWGFVAFFGSLHPYISEWWETHQQELEPQCFPTLKAAREYLEAFLCVHPLPETPGPRSTIVRRPRRARFAQTPDGTRIELLRRPSGWTLASSPGHHHFPSLHAAQRWADRQYPDVR